jgi:hypothetical protein
MTAKGWATPPRPVAHGSPRPPAHSSKAPELGIERSHGPSLSGVAFTLVPWYDKIGGVQGQSPKRHEGDRGVVWEAVGLAIAGAAVFWGGRTWAEGAAKTLLEVLGGGGVLLAPLIWRAEGKLSLGLTGLTLTLSRTERKRVAAILSAAVAEEERLELITQLAAAPHRALAGIIPFISGELASEVISIPPTWIGKTLKELPFIRQEHNVAVVAVRAEAEKPWKIGGAVTEMSLPEAGFMLVCGRPDDIRELRQRIKTSRSET